MCSDAHSITLNGRCLYILVFLCLVLTILNERAYLTFESIFHKVLNIFSSIAKSRSVLSNRGKVSCSRLQRGLLMGLESTIDTFRVIRATHC